MSTLPSTAPAVGKASSTAHRTLSAALLALATGYASSVGLQAQTLDPWVTMDDFQHTLGLSAVCGDIGKDAAGKVYAAGRYTAADGSSVAVVLGRDQASGSWVGLDAYAEPGLSYAHNRAFAAAPAGASPDVIGHLFAGGNLNNLRPNGTYEFDTLWFIREWNPVTGEWTTIDDSLDLVNDNVGQASCADILVAPSGDVYATGGGSPLGWQIRKRPAGALAFTTVDVDYFGSKLGIWLGHGLPPQLRRVRGRRR